MKRPIGPPLVAVSSRRRRRAARPDGDQHQEADAAPAAGGGRGRGHRSARAKAGSRPCRPNCRRGRAAAGHGVDLKGKCLSGAAGLFHDLGHCSILTGAPKLRLLHGVTPGRRFNLTEPFGSMRFDIRPLRRLFQDRTERFGQFFSTLSPGGGKAWQTGPKYGDRTNDNRRTPAGESSRGRPAAGPRPAQAPPDPRRRLSAVHAPGLRCHQHGRHRARRPACRKARSTSISTARSGCSTT